MIPQCIVTPLTAEEAADVVSVLVQNAGCDFAIKSGGHAPAAGFANIDGGVMIDLANLTTVTLSPDHSVASIGAGAVWLDAYRYLDAYNVTVAGGRNGLVGVGGLTLGGGISYLAPQVGWSCDTVVNFQARLSCGL